MASAPKIAMLGAALLVFLLWLLPLIGRLGEAASPEMRDPSSAPVSVRHLEAVENELLELANDERRKAGRPKLKREDDLRSVARGHNVDMSNRRFFSNVNPDGETPRERVANQHRRLVGSVVESILLFTGLSSDKVDALAQLIDEDRMGKEGYRRNILGENYTHLSVGVSQGDDEIHVTQLFGDVWGYLDVGLPLSVRRGASLDLVVEPTAGRGKVDQFDLFTKGVVVLGPNPLADGRIDVEPGSYRLRFYFRRDDDSSFSIVGGPQLEVVP